MGFIMTSHKYIKYTYAFKPLSSYLPSPSTVYLLLLLTHPSLIYNSIISFSSLIIITCMNIYIYIYPNESM